MALIQILYREKVLEPGALACSSGALAWSDGDQIILVRSDRSGSVFGTSGGPALPKTAPGRRGCLLKGHTGYVNQLAFHPDGNRLASGSQDFTVRVWDVNECVERMVLTDHQDMVVAVAFSPDGKLLASAGREERSVSLRDAQTGKRFARLEAQGSDTCLGIAFSPDSKRLVAADTAAKIWLWDIAEEYLSGVGTHEDIVMDVAYSPDGQLIASASQDGSVRLWKEDLSAIFHQFEAGGEVYCLAFHPAGRILAAGDIEGRIHLWDVETFLLLGVLNGHSKAVTDLVFHPNGTGMISISTDETILWWGLPGKDQGTEWSL